MHHKPKYLVVDTTAFIQNAPLQEMGENILTVQEVVNEVTSKRQLRRLVVLPYDLKITNVFPESVSFVTEFSKKTGDYPTLSAADIKLMALVYQLEKEHVGTDHLKSAPEHNKVVLLEPPTLGSGDLAGFFKGESVCKDYADNVNDECLQKEFHKTTMNITNKNDVECEFTHNKTNQEEIVLDDSAVHQKIALEEDFSSLEITDVLRPISEGSTHDEEEEEEEELDDDDDDSEWITPDNVKRIKQQMDFGLTEDTPVAVACVTTDFAMQNVLKQIGLNIVGLDGRVIKHLRTFILRCYSCFKTTSNMTKTFCPKCGNKTLKKVAVTVDENGQQKIHINARKPLTARGKKFSLPRPQGGKHASNPILCEDQPVPDQRPSRLARTKTNPLDDDYIAGYSPFVMRDVNSKSALLGITGKHQQVKYWMRKNPNEVIKHGRRKKK